jgi:hypothetical protein
MKPRHAAALALVAITMCSPSAFGDSAEELLAACRSVANAKVKGEQISIAKDFATGQCWGAFGVLQEEGRWVDPSGHRVWGVCTPSEVRRSELIAVFVGYLQRHPQRRHDDFAEVALDAFRAAYPCVPSK